MDFIMLGILRPSQVCSLQTFNASTGAQIYGNHLLTKFRHQRRIIVHNMVVKWKPHFSLTQLDTFTTWKLKLKLQLKTIFRITYFAS
jgi:hypothetical protein